MIWEKLGMIFQTEKYLDKNFMFSQSPQAIDMGEYLRIYFSTRKKDNNGKFLSEVCYVDYDAKFNVIRLKYGNIIKLGNLGEFDEHGIFPFSPFKNNNEIWAYTTGWSRRKSVSVETGIGLTKSIDRGETFEKYGSGGPILSSSTMEPMLVGDAFVKKIDSKYYMWYIYGKKWLPPTINEPEARVYVLAQAISNNGIDWERNSKQIINQKSEDECQALPTMAFFNGYYHLFFCYRNATDFRNNPKNAYKIGYAYSSDLKKWYRDDELVGIKPTNGSWDSDMMCYPNIFEWKDDIYLLYNGNEFGKYGFGIAKLKK